MDNTNARRLREAEQAASRRKPTGRGLIASRVGDRPDHARLRYSVERRRHLEVRIDLAVIYDIHRLTVIAEDHLVWTFQSTAVLRFLIGVGARVDILSKLGPFDACRFEELDPQYQRPSGDQALRAGIKNPVYCPEQVVVGAEVRRAPSNPINRIVGIPFKHWVDVAVG